MPGREHEAVAVGPVGRVGVVPHDPGPQHVGQRGERHRRAGVAAVGGLRHVHGQATDDVDGAGGGVGVSGHAEQYVAMCSAVLRRSISVLLDDEHLAYSCAYYTSDEPDYTLEDAQRDKLDLVCRKLGLTDGSRLLDIGCGWGSLSLHAAQHYGARVVGVTLSAASSRTSCWRKVAARA